MAVEIIVNGFGGQHDLDVKSAFILGYEMLGAIFADNIELRAESLNASFLYAQQNSTKIILRSTTGASGYIGLQKTYYPIQLIMPSGSNEYVQIYNVNGELPPIILTGAGDNGNETGYDIEFYSNDPMSVEPTDLSSYSNGFIAGALYYIAKQTNGDIWTARYLLRQALGNSWNNVNGYGKVDASAVTNAISLYDEQIDYSSLDIYISIEEETTNDNNLQGDIIMEDRLTRFLDAFDLPKEMSKEDIAALVSIIKPYKVYVANMAQSGTNAPVATELENTLGGTPIWTREDVGVYRITLAGAFPSTKLFIPPIFKQVFAVGVSVVISPATGDYLYVRTYSDAAPSDSVISFFKHLEIRVYP